MADLQTSAAHPSADTPSTSTAATYPAHYVYHDVFINHRGPDVKDTFATALYRRLLSHGLQPFLDKEELQKGEYIHPQIEGAIRTASVHIAIFSPRYAESPWCLDELRLILSKSGDTVIPVFHTVKPSDLRWATKDGNGQYAQALNCLEKKDRYDHEKLENWRKALNQASYMVGFELAAYNGDEVKLLEEVVGCVIKNRKKLALHAATYPTGLQVKIDDFEKTVLLQQQKNGKARVLGIVGMGGAGKTTLVKELFNRKNCDFNRSFFLYDVRETARLSSLTSLQSKLLKGLTEKTEQIDIVDEGIEILRRHLSSVHALIVMDDVDDAHQLRAFLPITDVLHSESLILVTSRYINVITSSGIAESSIYKLTGLNEQHSQQLFCSHAFLQPQPSPGFEFLVSEFCRACNGLPLYLRVFGALLCGKHDKPYWEGQLDKLRQIKLPSEIQERLKISYDALEEEEKQIFLDIACYFIGEDRDMVIRIWDGLGWNGLVGFRNLQDKCLVEVVKEYKLESFLIGGRGGCPYTVSTIKMHDHLRDLGRKIVDQEKCSGVIPHRLWRVIEDIHDLSQQSCHVRGIRTVDGLIGYHDIEKSKDKLSDQVLRKWKLTASSSKVHLPGDLKPILDRVESPNLIWLRWNNCPDTDLPSWIPMKNIRVLQVKGRELETLWEKNSQAPLQLRELYISAPLAKFPKSISRLKHIEKIVMVNIHCKSLPEEFCHLPSLKYLLLIAQDLESLPDSFGSLTNLQDVNLSICRLLQGLPDSFLSLTNLQRVNLSSCRSLQGLPDSFRSMTNLQHVNLSSCTSLQGLPDSFGSLSNLKDVDLKNCTSLQGLPDSFGSLTNLNYVDLRSCRSLQGLPDSFGSLTNLQRVDLRSCRSLQGLPDSFGSLTSLQQVYLSGCTSLQGLPDSFGSLTNLKYVDLSSCTSLQGLPDSFGSLTNLKYVDLSYCASLQGLPDSFGSLTNLQGVYLSICTSLQGLPDSFGSLTNLQRVNLRSCKSLQGLPDSFGSLTNLKDVDLRNCRSLQGLPDSFGSLTNLKDVDLSSCTSLQGLPDSFGSLTNLQRVDLSSCTSLQGLPDSFGSLYNLGDLNSLVYIRESQGHEYGR